MGLLLVSLSSVDFTVVNWVDELTAGSFAGVFLVGLPYLQLDFEGLPWNCSGIYRNLKGNFQLQYLVNSSLGSVGSTYESDGFDFRGGFVLNPFLEHQKKKLEAVRLLDAVPKGPFTGLGALFYDEENYNLVCPSLVLLGSLNIWMRKSLFLDFSLHGYEEGEPRDSANSVFLDLEEAISSEVEVIDLSEELVEPNLFVELLDLQRLVRKVCLGVLGNGGNYTINGDCHLSYVFGKNEEFNSTWEMVPNIVASETNFEETRMVSMIVHDYTLLVPLKNHVEERLVPTYRSCENSHFHGQARITDGLDVFDGKVKMDLYGCDLQTRIVGVLPLKKDPYGLDMTNAWSLKDYALFVIMMQGIVGGLEWHVTQLVPSKGKDICDLCSLVEGHA